MLSQMEGGCPVDYSIPTDLFLQFIEINLVTSPNVADAILANGMFSHYDRPGIAELCEKAGLYVRALKALVEFFGTLSKEWAMDCMKDLLMVNLRGNLQIIVQNCLEKIFSRSVTDSSLKSKPTSEDPHSDD
ncbi:hypothetical protein OROHE_020600 [Orobanche hederae]